MANIQNVKLSVQPVDENNWEVSVRFRPAFTTGEAGKKFRYSISLHANDINVNPSDEDPSPSPLYKFKFGNSFTKTITGGQFTADRTEKNNVPRETLDEDSGASVTGKFEITRHQDEVYAQITLITGASGVGVVAAKKRTNTVTFRDALTSDQVMSKGA